MDVNFVLEALLETNNDEPRSSRTEEQLLYINVQRFRGGLVFKAHRLSYHSTLGLRVMTKKMKTWDADAEEERHAVPKILRGGCFL